MTLPAGLLPARLSEIHKGQTGHVGVIAGSAGLTGAAALCSLGALRAGAGLVTLAIPAGLQDVMAAKLTEVMTRPFPETKSRSFSLQALPALVQFAEAVDAVVIGPGLSQEPQTKQLVRQLLTKVTKPCVIDADGLNAVAEEIHVLKRMPRPAVVTPHPGEMARLAKLGVEDVQRDRERLAKEFAMRYQMVTVLKGHRTVIANVDGDVQLNDTGNPGMASGGMGDVLGGMIAALIGQGLSLFDAARLGVHLHGAAGDLAAADRGPVGLLASDLLDRIPQAIRHYQHAA